MSGPGPSPHLVFCILSDERVFAARSPAVFNRVMSAAGINATYVPFCISPARLGEAVRSLKVLNIAGANVTVPYKEAVIPYMDALSESANIIGAVNTISIRKDTVKGYNTNAIGIMDALEETGFDPAGKSALILGTGGAAKAAAFVLNWLRAEKIWIAGRSISKARSISGRVRGAAFLLDDLQALPRAPHILVNATTVSCAAESPELIRTAEQLPLSGCELVYDLNYGREANFWQALAAGGGIRFMDGLSTLSHQARNSLSLWTGVEVGPEHFRNALAG
jgi:shikimate dehydrogenase